MIPVPRQAMLRLWLVTLAPLAPLALTTFSVDDVARQLAKMIF